MEQPRGRLFAGALIEFLELTRGKSKYRFIDAKAAQPFAKLAELASSVWFYRFTWFGVTLTERVVEGNKNIANIPDVNKGRHHKGNLEFGRHVRELIEIASGLKDVRG